MTWIRNAGGRWLASFKATTNARAEHHPKEWYGGRVAGCDWGCGVSRMSQGVRTTTTRAQEGHDGGASEEKGNDGKQPQIGS